MVWDVSRGEVVKAGQLPRVAAVSGRGLTLSAATGGGLCLTSLSDAGREGPARPKPFGTGDVRAVTFLQDGTTAASVDESSHVRLWDVRTARELRSVQLPQSAKPSTPRLIAAGKVLLVVADDGSVLSLDADLDMPPGGLKPGTAVGAAAASSSPARLIAVANDGNVRVFDPLNGNVISELGRRDPGVATAVAISQDGRRAAVAKRVGDVELWDVDPPRVLDAFHFGINPVRALAFSHDGASIIVASDDTVHVLRAP
jgi:WD40 repeat protein